MPKALYWYSGPEIFFIVSLSPKKLIIMKPKKKKPIPNKIEEIRLKIIGISI